MVDTKNCTKNEVKDTEGQYGLPETNEMEAERYARKNLVALDGTQDLLCRRFGFEDREDAGVHAVEHTRIDIVGCNGGETHIGLHLLEFDTHGVAPTNHSPLAGTIDGHLGIAEHAARRGDIADMTAVAGNHIWQDLLRNDHRRNGVYLKSEADVLHGLLVESLVATHDACAVDEDVDSTHFLLDLLVGLGNELAVSDVHLIDIYAPARGEFSHSSFQSLLIHIPDNQRLRPFLQRHSPHDLANTRSSSSD